MSISFNEEHKMFHIKNKKYSYVMTIEEHNIRSHSYFGASIRNLSSIRNYPRLDRSFSPNMAGSQDRLFSLDTLPQEYASFGGGDFREPAIIIRLKDGSTISDFRYKKHRICEGKRKIEGLPQTYGNLEECETLEIVLKDQIAKVEVTLSYTNFLNYAVLVRSTKVINLGLEKIQIEKIMSFSLDLPNFDYELLHLNGTWAREAQLTREPIHPGIKVIDSKRGASSHQQNPFFALVTSSTTEHQGEAFGFNLVYSGNFMAQLQMDAYKQLRLNFGINSFQFSWTLEKGESFVTPEAVMTYSDSGLNHLSQNFHSFYQKHLLRGKYKEIERPILINNWEATYFEFTEESLKEIVHEASELGVELFVLDDGWFGSRDSDTEALGDWFVNEKKFPKGIQSFSKFIKEKNMKFGIWVEPEMISEKSNLYVEHPEWAFQVEGRGKSLSRSQYVLDLTRKDVREYLEERLTHIFEEADVDYVKWDMNRHITEAYSQELSVERQGEVHHRYMLGLYELLENITTRFPTILFESCSGGGGRFDPGMLYYMPQTWTSDNTDPISRLNIQYGTSMVYPIVSMGAHVSASPNHQINRITSLEMRGATAFAGNLGYELNVLNLTDYEREMIKGQISFYKKHRKLIQYGDFYRLLSPFQGNECAWMFVSKNQTEALIFYYQILSQASAPLKILKMQGLEDCATYYFEGEDTPVGGDELMKSGMYLPPNQAEDFTSFIRYLSVEKNK